MMVNAMKENEIESGNAIIELKIHCNIGIVFVY